MHRLRSAALVAAPLIATAVATTPLAAQNSLRVNAPNTQTMVSAIPNRRGALCDPCIIRGYDGGFARLSFEDVAPQAGDLRIRATLTIDSDPDIVAPNGSGGEVITRVADLGQAWNVLHRRVNVVIVLTATNPVTGETSRSEMEVSGSSENPHSTVGLSGTYWPAVHRRLEEVKDVTQVYNEFRFQVAEIRWESVDLGGVRYLDAEVRRRLAAAERAEQERQAAAARAEQERQAAAAGSTTGAATTGAATTGASSTGASSTGRSSTGAGSSGSTSAGSGNAGRPAAQTQRPSTQRPAANAGADSATAAREAEARRQGVDMIEGPQRQAEATRRQREAQAAATAAAAVAAVSLLAELLPDGNFSTLGIGGSGGTVGSGFWLDGGPGWKLTPRRAQRHVAISAPSLILGFNSPSLGDFNTYYQDDGEPGPTNKPATLTPSFSFGLGGNFYADLPINRTALNVSAYYIWSGVQVVEPADGGKSGTWLLRAEMIKPLPTPRAYSRYGTEWAWGLGVGLQSQRVSWDDSNGLNNRNKFGPFLSLRFLMINN
jgi:hypothetical protein